MVTISLSSSIKKGPMMFKGWVYQPMPKTVKNFQRRFHRNYNPWSSKWSSKDSTGTTIREAATVLRELQSQEMNWYHDRASSTCWRHSLLSYKERPALAVKPLFVSKPTGRWSIPRNTIPESRKQDFKIYWHSNSSRKKTSTFKLSY